MANTISNIKDAGGVIAKGMAETLRDNLVFCSNVDQADASDFDGRNGYKAGDTIYTNIPARYIPQQDNLDITSLNADSVEDTKALTLDKTETVRMDFNSLELATDVDIASVMKRYCVPAAESIAQNVEARCLDLARQSVANSVGTYGSNSFTVADILAARTKLNQQLAPSGNRKLLLTSESGAAAVDARKGLFQSSSEIASQYKKGQIGTSDGFDWYESELLPTHTNGADVAGLVNDASFTEGSNTVTVDGYTAAVAAGSTITIANVFEVHPITKETTDRLKQFVVTSATTTELTLSEGIYASATDGRKNVDALPADNAAVTSVGAADTSAVQNFAWHPSSFKFVTVPMIQPDGVHMVASETVDGITVNLISDFEPLTRKVITRADILYGFDPVRPEWATKITA